MEMHVSGLRNNPLHWRDGEDAERSEAGEAGTHEHLATYAPIPHLSLALSAPRRREGRSAHMTEFHS